MRRILPICLLLLSGLLLSACRVPNLNQTATFTQANVPVEGTSVGIVDTNADSQGWQYAKLSTFSHSGELQATWTTGDGVIPATGGVLVLAEKIMGTLISDTDDAFIIFFDYLGMQGWELVQIRDVDRRTEYWFKRIQIIN